MRKRGFTFLELLAVVGLLALLGSFIVPTFQLLLSQYQLSNSTEQVAELMRLTEQRTVTEQQPYGLTFTSGAGSVPEFKYDPSSGNKSLITTLTLPSNLVIGTVSFSGNTDVIFATSGAPNYSGSLTITDTVRQKNKLILLRPSGAVLDNQSEY